jgi:radical SAM superfamily enzyme YgiQ (UPF0313 family)
MKIVVVGPPTPNPSPSYFGPPMGLALLGAILKKQGHEVRGYDWDRSTMQAMLDDVPRMLAEDRPDLFGISCLSITRGPSYALARAVRAAAPGLPIVFGGPYPTLAPDEVLERTPADYVCIGDGEETFPELVRVLVEGGDPSAVAGLALRKNGAIQRTLPRPDFKDLDALPYPDLDMFGVGDILSRARERDGGTRRAGLRAKGRAPFVTDAALMVLGSRGCVWRCDFCPMSKFDGRTRMHSPEYIVDYIAHLVERYGHKELVFGDNTLTWWRPHSVELFERMIARNLGVEWICMTRADRVDPELLTLMQRAGCREISFGIESGSEDVHKTIKKKLKLGRVAQAFHETHAAGINTTCMLMIGNRGETKESLHATTGLVRDTDPDRILIWTTKVYPGTVLHDVAVAEGAVPAGYYDDELAPAPYYTGEHSLEDLHEFERLLQHRTMWIDVTPSRPPENAGPAEESSMARGAASADLDRIDHDLRMSTWRAEGGTVLGGPSGRGTIDPFERPDVWEILERGKRYETKNVIVETDAHALGKMATCERAHRSSAIAGIQVPLWSTSDAHHDARVGREGALLRTRRGLARWTRDHAFVRALAMLDRFNVGTAWQWVRWMKEHRIPEAVLVYGESPSGWQHVAREDLPGLREAAESIARAAEEGSRLGVRVLASGLPRCHVPKGVEVFEGTRPFDEAIREDGEPYNLSIARRETKKQFGPTCEGCTLRGQCEGVWSDAWGPETEGLLRPVRDPKAGLRAAPPTKLRVLRAS